MLTNETKEQFNEIFLELSKNIDISETEYKKAVESYQAVGSWLSDKQSILKNYNPEILPQGSFLLGTTVKPINDNDQLDVDLVCRLEGKNPDWAQFNLKKIVGDRLKAHGKYCQMLDKEGRRCWTLNYADVSNYHMDILPSLVSQGHKEILEKAFSKIDFQDYDQAAIRITDKLESNYFTETNPKYWNKSNPFGYAVWFQQRCNISLTKTVLLSESINPIPRFQDQKLPLQRVVQLLKRHRDIMFNGDEDKPISIIITTLASKAYQKEVDVISALNNVVDRMELFIEDRFSSKYNRNIKWIYNPINSEENFADKWPENPKKEQNFYSWLKRVKTDLASSYELRGIQRIEESFSRAFGEKATKTSLGSLADRTFQNRENGNLFMKHGSGILGASAINSSNVKSHSFHGKREN
jgi:hypothetical protein